MKTIYAVLLMCFAGFAFADGHLDDGHLDTVRNVLPPVDLDGEGKMYNENGNLDEEGEFGQDPGAMGEEEGSGAMGDDGDAGSEGPQP
jgi:hypothetical protein